jgi:pimeloyl-ACP methyl ester carboxylesterase
MVEVPSFNQEHDRRSSFEQRFEQGRRRYESLGGAINAVVVRPDNPKTDVPVLLAPGWSEGASVLKDCVRQLYAAGRPVIALDHPRSGGIVDSQGGHPIDELRKALTIREVIQQENVPQVDILAHSEGAINGAIAASLGPESVRNMILVSPAGLIGKDTMPGLVGRFAKKGWQSFENILDKDTHAAFIRGQIEGVKYVAQNPLRAYQEASAISHSEIDGLLYKLHSQGIGIVVIHGVDDLGFPMDRMQQVVKSVSQPDGFVDGFLSVKGGHEELYLRPEKYTRAAEKMLTALEQKR